MPEMKLGHSQDSWNSVRRAFESEADLSSGQGGDRDDGAAQRRW